LSNITTGTIGTTKILDKKDKTFTCQVKRTIAGETKAVAPKVGKI